MGSSIDERIDDWEKLKKALRKYQEEKRPELRETYRQNFYDGLRLYFQKYDAPFDHKEKPEERNR